MKTVILNNLEWMAENLTGHGGTEINGNWYYTWFQAMNAAKEIGNGWRLPTANEFEKLYNSSTSHRDKKLGTFCNPDNGLGLPMAEESKESYDIGDEWDEKRKGCWFGKNKELFLPALGGRCVYSSTKIDDWGLYWSCSPCQILNGKIGANNLCFSDFSASHLEVSEFSWSYPVRLVRDMQK